MTCARALPGKQRGDKLTVLREGGSGGCTATHHEECVTLPGAAARKRNSGGVLRGSKEHTLVE